MGKIFRAFEEGFDKGVLFGARCIGCGTGLVLTLGLFYSVVRAGYWIRGIFP